jgi:hypothetical protein
MTKKETVAKIFDRITNQIEVFDFKVDLKNQWFVRRTSNSVFTYDIHFYDRTNIKSGAKGFLVEPYIWINVKEIENYYKEITVNRELKSDTDFKTLGSNVAEFLSNPDGIHKKWNESLDLFVFEEKHAEVAANELLHQFEKFVLPYFLANGNVQAVDHLLNQHPAEYCVHMSNDLFRFIKGLIAAKLNSNPKLESLLQIYDRLIIDRDMPDNCKEEMSRLKSILPMIGANISV